MANIIIPCPGTVEIKGKVKVVERNFPTGPAAENSAIDAALAQATRDANSAMRGCRCAGACGRVGFRMPPKIRIGASGSQNNPAFPIVGAAIAYWSIFPVCNKPPKAPAKPKAPPAAAPGPQPHDIDPVTTPQIPKTTGHSPYPFSKVLPCGTVTVRISDGADDERKGGIIFEFTPVPSENCDCKQFGWIQHVQRGQGNEWHYDNGAWHMYINGTGIGDFSDPTQPVQPTGGTGRHTPWYGTPSFKTDPEQFAKNPTPQTKIGDKPSEQITSFVTQLVCIESGQVVFQWYWGPVLDQNQPLEQVPAGPEKE